MENKIWQIMLWQSTNKAESPEQNTLFVNCELIDYGFILYKRKINSNMRLKRLTMRTEITAQN